MENRIKINDFIKITGTTRKTVLYYHKIGLLPEPERSSGGYRLYGPAELNRMRLIKRLKALGFDLPGIKGILGDLNNDRSLRDVLQSLLRELQDERNTLDERIAKIRLLLEEEALLLDADTTASPSFALVGDILGKEQMDKYASMCPDIYDRHRRLYGILDDFQLGDYYQETIRSLAEYYKDHPEKYQMALDSGAGMARLDLMDEDDPEIDILARKAADLVRSMPPVKEILCKPPDSDKAQEHLIYEMVFGSVPPARVKYQRLFEKYLKDDGEE